MVDPRDAFDVAVVGYGPVGQALTAMLSRRGHRVVVIERWPELFPLPRAGHLDHEIMRILQGLGIADALAEDAWKVTQCEFRDRNGDVLTTMTVGDESPSGWYSDYSMFQPFLESLLHQVVTSNGQAELLRGWQAEEIEVTDHVAELVARRGRASDGVWTPSEETRRIRADYLVGCDGANSVVRTATGREWRDFGFEADWLVVFAEPSDPSIQGGMPDVAQLLDPARPTTALSRSGKRYCRWEFMLLPGETPEQMSTEEVAWSLIRPWGLTADNSRLIRHSVFRFQSLVATDWRAGRAFIAGDAAHLMPPFLGQGLCSGLRDALNLSWKLDLVLRGVAAESLLDTYTLERRPQVEHIVEAAVGIGEIIAVIDPEAAAERDRRVREGALAPDESIPPLGGGVLRHGDDRQPRSPAGLLSRQGQVGLDGRVGRFDDVVGSGWVVITTGWDARDGLSAEALATLRELDAHIVRVESEPSTTPGVAADRAGAYLPWLAELGVDALVIRPDLYIFGGASGPGDLEAAIAELRRRLTITRPVQV